MKGRRLFAFAALALAFGCRGEKLPTAPEQRAAPTDPSQIISDGAHNGGNPDFFFLPPMVPLPLHNANFELGHFNNTLKNSLKIDICELNSEPNNGLPNAATGCARPVKSFAPGSLQVVNLPIRQNGWWNLFGLPADGFYYALWDTRQSNLNVSKYYRIKVYIAGSPDVLLGIADVDPMANLFQWKYTLTNEVIQLVDNTMLPIVFRVENGGGPALCGTGVVCNSVTVTNNNPAGFQTVTVDGGSGAVAGAKFPNGWLPAGGPQSVVVTISSVNTGASNPATGTQTLPCHANLPLQQFRGCFNFSTTPRLATNDSGDQFATPVVVAVCYVLQGTGDPREKFAEMWASGPNEPPHPLDDASDAGILSPATRDCSNSIIGSNNSKGVTGFASAGWQTLKGGLGAIFGVKTAYGVDLGLGGITKKFSNVGPALSARLDTASPAHITLTNGGLVTPFVRVVGSNHHDNQHQNSTGLGGIPVAFAASANTTLAPQGVGGGTATQLTATTNTLPIIDGNPTSGGGFAAVNWNIPNTPGTYTLTVTGPTTNGPVTFTAVVPETPPPPFINFENLPPGAGVCDGQAACSVTDEFASLGVVFSFSNTDQTASLCRTIHGPVGEGSNFGVSPQSNNDCTGWNTGTVTMTFGGHPTTVEFTLEGNNLGPPPEGPFPVAAFDTQGNALTVDRTDETIYQDQFQQAFRRETRRVTSPNGIATIAVDSNVSIRIIDNLLIVP